MFSWEIPVVPRELSASQVLMLKIRQPVSNGDGDIGNLVSWSLGTWRCFFSGDWRRVATGSLTLYGHGSGQGLAAVLDLWGLHGLLH